jgi:hypothetical protein
LTIDRVDRFQDVCRGSAVMSGGRCKFAGGRVGIILAALCGVSLSGSLAFAKELRVDAGPCSPDGDLAAQRARVSEVLGRLAEKLQFVAVIRDPSCRNQHRLVVDVSVLSDSGGGSDPPPPPTLRPELDGEAIYLRAHGLSPEE